MQKNRWNTVSFRLYSVLLIISMLLGVKVDKVVSQANPSLAVNVTDNWVQGYMWPLDAVVTLRIDGNDIDTQSVTEAEWNPNDTLVSFDLGESHILQAGQVIELTNGNITKTHTVANLIVEGIDIEADTVYGTVDAGAQVDVGHIYCDENGCYGYRRVTAAENGAWVADFSVAGDNEDEQDIVDIQPGMRSDARHWDEDGDSTVFSWSVPDPRICVYANDDVIEGWNWTNEAIITVEIEDLDSLDTPDYSGTTTVTYSDWDPEQTWFKLDLRDIYDIQENDVVTVSDGIYTKVLVVSNLAITDVGLEEDVVTGVAPADSWINVWICGSDYCVNREEHTDSEGIWIANFKDPGDLGWEQETFDIQPDVWVEANHYDEDGDTTNFARYIPNPIFNVRANTDQIEGWGWTKGAEVTVTIGDPSSQSYSATTPVITEGDGEDQTSFRLDLWDKYDIQVGELVTVSDGTYTKDLIVADLEITDIDVETDVVTGNAPENSLIYVWVCNNDYCVTREQPTDSFGNWSADFSDLGGEPFDIKYGNWVDASHHDEDGDTTNFGMHAPNPIFNVRANTDQIEGWGWTKGAEVTVTIGDPSSQSYSATTPVITEGDGEDQTSFRLDLQELYDIKVGERVTVSDGIYTKDLIVADLEITDIDVETDVVTGTAPVNSLIYVWVCNNDYCVTREQPTNSFGNWSADFSVSGDQDWEWETFDIKYGNWVDASHHDEDGDTTNFGMHAPNPIFNVRANADQIEGWGWTEGADVTVMIDPDFSITTPVYPPDEYNDQPWFKLDLWDNYDIQVGDVVTVSDGIYTKDLIVADFEITDIDVVTDVVTGTAPVNSLIYVWVCYYDDCVTREETTDSSGNWSADFSVSGDQEWEWETFNIYYGNWVDASHHDEDGDTTNFGMSVDPDPLELDFSDGTKGSTFTIFGQDYPPDSEGTIYLNWDPIGTFWTDLEGCFEFTITMPDDAESGTYIVTVSVNPTQSVSITINPASEQRNVDQQETHIDVPSDTFKPVQVGAIIAPIDPIQVGNPVNIYAAFDSPLGKYVTAVLDWGDGSRSVGFNDEFTVTGSHVYDIPGVYTLTLILDYPDGSTITMTHEYIVVYDPEGGFVTGGGWIWSPEGAYYEDSTLTGRATFGFVSKYKKGKTYPEGNTEFQFKVADLRFQSSDYDWLVIAGKAAKFKGTGSINDEGEYKFMISAIDGDLQGGDGLDKFRIKIWSEVDGVEDIIYDNQIGDAIDADPTTVLGGGSIVLHSK